MRHLNLRSALMFLAVVEEGSIAKAAARENIVSSAVSKRLQELEAAVGVPLLERSQRGVRLTPAGEAMAHHARLIVQALDRMRSELKDFATGVRGYVRIRVSASALAAGTPADLMAFTARHADIRLDLEERETPAIIQDITEGRADIGIGPSMFACDELQVSPYRRYDLAVAVPRGHALAGRMALAYEETLVFDQVEQPQSSALAQLLNHAAKQTAHLKQTRIRVRGFDGVCHMIGSGMGIGVVPSFLSRTYEATYGLAFIPLSDSWARQRIVIMVRSEKSLSSSASLLLKHLRAASDAGLG